MMTIKKFNDIARTHNLKLHKGGGYFYWLNATDDTVEQNISSIYGICHFSHGSDSYWMTELNVALEQRK